MNRYNLCFSLFFILITAFTAQGQRQGRIIGEVKDSDGALIGFAKIKFEEITETKNSQSETIKTDDDGHFQYLIAPGVYLVTVEAEAFAKMGKIIKINLDEQLEVSFTLFPVNSEEIVYLYPPTSKKAQERMQKELAKRKGCITGVVYTSYDAIKNGQFLHKDKTGKMVASATISLDGSFSSSYDAIKNGQILLNDKAGKMVASATISPDGSFSFQKLRPNSYLLTILINNVEQFHNRITVKSNEGLWIPIKLEP